MVDLCTSLFDAVSSKVIEKYSHQLISNLTTHSYYVETCVIVVDISYYHINGASVGHKIRR